MLNFINFKFTKEFNFQTRSLDGFFCQKLWKFVSDFFRFIKAKNLSKTKQAIYENNEAKQAS